MKVKLLDIKTPRSDGIYGPPTHVTVGEVYTVVENKKSSDKYSIMNDKMKVARYSKHRFEIVDDTPPQELREAFNSLTLPMRQRIRELETLLNEKGITL